MYVGAALWGGYLGFFYLREKMREVRKHKKYEIWTWKKKYFSKQKIRIYIFIVPFI